ncbi:hypothetical protein SESBI_21056 [Sesbania bispinosa]|nr:hypothetical protein SESBI_21056 [Sesbania bispinosa]
MRKVGGAALQWLAAVVAGPRRCDGLVAVEMRSCARKRGRTIANGDRLWPRRRLTNKGVDGLWCAAARGGDGRLWEVVRRDDEVVGVRLKRSVHRGLMVVSQRQWSTTGG